MWTEMQYFCWCWRDEEVTPPPPQKKVLCVKMAALPKWPYNSAPRWTEADWHVCFHRDGAMEDFVHG